ncbi:hypothetical protein PENSPDRAFT_739706 [Peniophora sp. CONT]|nr:hypothetical protein PENSPDRAFT_739706 [Peniophora sp. CONT]
MRVSRRFRDIACSAHSLWASHVLAPLLVEPSESMTRNELKDHERRVISQVSTLVERSKSELLSLQLPYGISDYRVRNLVGGLLPSLVTRSRSITTALGHSPFAVGSFWAFLKVTGTPTVRTLSVSSSRPSGCYEANQLTFPFESSTPPQKIDLPCLRNLALVNVLPPCPFPGLRSLSISFDNFSSIPSKDFIIYLRSTPQLTRLVLYQCLLVTKDAVQLQPVELPHLKHVELTCGPTLCAFFLERVHFPAAAVFIWNDTRETYQHGNDVTRMADTLREHLDSPHQHRYGAFLRISDNAYPIPSDDLYNKTWSSWSHGPHVTIALYRDMDKRLVTDVQEEDNLTVRLDFKGYRDVVFLANRLSHLVQPSCISALTIATMDNLANVFFGKHASDIIHSFPALTDFAWLNLTTPENLAQVVRAVLDPSMMPLLRSLRIRELGQRVRNQWRTNPSVVALCEGLRERREAGCPLDYVPCIDTVISLKNGYDKTMYRRGVPMAHGELLDKLRGMLDDAQGTN